MTSNLHTLLNRQWYIHRPFAEANLPLLFNLIDGNFAFEKVEEEEIGGFANKAGSVSADFGETNSNEKYAVVISLKNPIYKYNQECGPRGTKSKMAAMDRYKNDDSIAGIILDIDSGGGQVSGTPEFYDYIKSYPKPVVTYTDGMMCSAAYYIGSSADHVIANRRADAIGSIGAYSQFLDLQGYYEKKGAKLHTIYATKSTEKNQAYREALEGNYDMYIKQELDPIVDDFISDIKEVRKGVSESVFKGGTWNASESLEKGLIDAIGTFQDAIDKVFELSQVNNQISNTSTMSKNREELQAVLGLDGPLAATEEHGSYLNEDQLDAVENRLTEQATAVANAQTEAQTAKDDLATEQTASTEVANKVNALAALANAETGETVADTLANLENRINEMNAKPGDSHTTAKKKENEEEASHPYMDFDTPFYNKAKSLLN